MACFVQPPQMSVLDVKANSPFCPAARVLTSRWGRRDDDRRWLRRMAALQRGARLTDARTAPWWLRQDPGGMGRVRPRGGGVAGAPATAFGRWSSWGNSPFGSFRRRPALHLRPPRRLLATAKRRRTGDLAL